jgi:FAD/FMN-containing dehydrogenase
MKVGGWGRFPIHESERLIPARDHELLRFQREGDGLIPRGNGRAYGDAAIGTRQTMVMGAFNRMRSFDPETGLLTVEAGTLLSDIIATFLPRGYFPAVVPGTRFVTVGGMVAADVHGKNHHGIGGFGEHVANFSLAAPDGAVLRCSRTENQELFFATIGGMGLTGTVLDVTLNLVPVETGWITETMMVASNLSEALRLLDARPDLPYSVAWIDCLARGQSLGRSLVCLGGHASRDSLTGPEARASRWGRIGTQRFSVPIDVPDFALSRWSVAALNEIYFRRGAARGGKPFLTDWSNYFFPLDAIGNWNRVYGKRGFLQHQCVIPGAAAESVLGQMLERIARRGNASFLAVLKRLKAGTGLLSFPMQGYTLALDLKIEDGVFAFLDELDRLVVEGGGRLYLAKDARQSPRTFEAGYPRREDFRMLRQALGAQCKMESYQAKRLGL